MDYKDFVKSYPVSKTLRFELKPVGETWDNLEANGYLADDYTRSQNYAKAKELLDNIHRDYIDKVLSNTKFDWKPLMDALIARKKNLTDASRKDYIAKQKDAIGFFEKELTDKNNGYDRLTGKSVLDDAKERCREQNDLEGLKTLNAFDKFTVYFSGYYVNRENMYSGKNKVSVPYRIVVDNFPKFVGNIQKYNKFKEIDLKNSDPVLKKLKENLGIDDLDKYFDVNNYNLFITQSGIEQYNYLFEGKKTESENKQGFNELLNLEWQKQAGLKSESDAKLGKKGDYKMEPLYKQILSIQNKSYIPKQFNDMNELIETLCNFVQSIDDNKIPDKAYELVCNLDEDVQNRQNKSLNEFHFDLSKIHIDSSNINNFSEYVFNSWESLGGRLQNYYATKYGDPKMTKTRDRVNKDLKKGITLDVALEAVCLEDSFSLHNYTSKLSDFCKKIKENKIHCKTLTSLDFSKMSDDEYEDNVVHIREMLDPYVGLLHLINVFEIDDSYEKDGSFYADLSEITGKLRDVISIYNKSRNYCTKKRYDASKIKVNLKFPTLADGWDCNKEKDNKAIILRKEGTYYLGVMTKGLLKSNKAPSENDSVFEKMEYKLLPSPVKMLPKIFVKSKSAKELYGLTDELLEGYESGKHKNGATFDIVFCHSLIDYYKKCIKTYESWSVFDFHFSDTNEYKDMSDFYNEINNQNYKVSFVKIKSEEVYKQVKDGLLFLFKIYNKDFKKKDSDNIRCPCGVDSYANTENLHTLYWKALFSDENLSKPTIKLNGQAELFFRKASISSPSIHKSGSVLVNRKTVDGLTIPGNVYKELVGYYNHSDVKLSTIAQEYVSKVKVKNASHDIIKDRRFTVDKMTFHVPITFNYSLDSKNGDINKKVVNSIIRDSDLKIIGIDRGERNLIYISMIDCSGRILYQRSLNIINDSDFDYSNDDASIGCYDYQKALDVREKGNKDSRRNWMKIEGIRQFKEGYLSKVVHYISKLVIENNAILVMEDLNYGFKRGRFGIEKQVYQKFENMLISKLNYLVLKSRSDCEAGGALNGYQLTNLQTDVSTSVKQTGIIFYVPAAFTSKIDPSTGFANLFNFGSVPDTIDGRRRFLMKFKAISFDTKEGRYAFSFDYRDFNTKTEDFRNNWTVYSADFRYVYSRKNRCYETKNPTSMIKNALLSSNIDDNCILDHICNLDGKALNDIFYAFKLSVEMRVENESEDYIMSPVKDEEGLFFCSNTKNHKTPVDSDANGAYHIALKGNLTLNLLKETYDEFKPRVEIPLISNKDWLRYMQSRDCSWRK